MITRTAAMLAASVALAAPAAAQETVLEQLAREAAAVRPLVSSGAAASWLDQAPRLTEIEPRTIYYAFGQGSTRAYTPAEYAELPTTEREGLQPTEITTDNYYQTQYGTPVVYARTIDLIAETAGPGYQLRGQRILDFGYGQIGQLKMLAMAGADAVGFDVDPLLRATYAHAGDTGNAPGGTIPGGSVELVHGLFPGDPATVRRVGGWYDSVVARNVLKRGYVDPVGETAAWQRVEFGASKTEALVALREAITPGGTLLIYNVGLGPAQSEDGYNPAADIACPWTQGELRLAGFEIIAHDADDTDAMRELARALGWDGHLYQIEIENLFAAYTLVRRPG